MEAEEEEEEEDYEKQSKDDDEEEDSKEEDSDEDEEEAESESESEEDKEQSRARPLLVFICTYTIFINGHLAIFCLFKFLKKIHVTTLSSTTKYVIMGSFSVFGSMVAKLWLIQI